MHAARTSNLTSNIGVFQRICSLATCQAAHQRLEAFNDFSHARYQDIQRRFRSHTATLIEMKRDLDQVFRTLR